MMLFQCAMHNGSQTVIVHYALYIIKRELLNF